MARRTVGQQPVQEPQTPARTGGRYTREDYHQRTAEVVNSDTGEVTYAGTVDERTGEVVYNDPPQQRRGPAPQQTAQRGGPAPQQTAQRGGPAPQQTAQRGGPVATIAQQADTQLPAALLERYKQDAGKGVSSAIEDNLIPLIYLLQTNSPQVVAQSDRYVQDAVPGAFWLRNCPSDPIMSGEDGMEFQPCYAYKEWVIWGRPRGVGIIDRQKRRPADAQLVEVIGDDGNKRKAWVMSDGSEAVETRYHIGLILNHPSGRPIPYSFPMSGAKHSFSKGWTTVMNGLTIGGYILPSWSHSYCIVSRYQRRGNYAYFVIELRQGEKPLPVTEELYEMGAALYEAFARGEKTVDTSGLEDEDTDAAESAM